MSRGHKWERLVGSTSEQTAAYRLDVPGGWIYSDPDGGGNVFVPAPPRLVALEKANGAGVWMANPREVAEIGAARDGSSWVRMAHTTEDAVIYVKGTPAEVAASLGLEIWNDAPFACAGVFHPDGAESSTCAVCGEDREAHDSVDPGEVS